MKDFQNFLLNLDYLLLKTYLHHFGIVYLVVYLVFYLVMVVYQVFYLVMVFYLYFHLFHDKLCRNGNVVHEHEFYLVVVYTFLHMYNQMVYEHLLPKNNLLDIVQHFLYIYQWLVNVYILLDIQRFEYNVP